MKYRVRIDLSFDSETDTTTLMEYLRFISDKAVSINEGKDNEEIAYFHFEKCFHDELPHKPCEKIEGVEIRKVSAVAL